jgi:hypothetical protein
MKRKTEKLRGNGIERIANSAEKEQQFGSSMRH